MTRFADSWRPRALVTLLAGTLCLTSGCSLFNPHLEPSVPLQTYGKSMPTDAELATMSTAEQNALLKAAIQPTPTDEQLAAMTAEQKKAVLLALLKPEFAGGVGPAIDRVNAWREAYYDAVGDQSMMKNGIALAVIPAAAVAGYFGLTGGSRDVIAGLATGAAGLLGLGVFFESENRQQIYLNGYRAMGCLLFASAPLLMPKTQYDKLQSDVLTLDDDLAALDLAIADAQTQADLETRTAFATLVAQASSEIAGAKQLVVKAEQAQSGGMNLLSRITQAGLIIETAAGDIAAAVSSQIVDDEPNLSSLTEITGGLAGTAQRVARIPPAKEEKAPEGLQGNIPLATALETLRTASAKVASKARSLQLTVNQYADVTQSLVNIKGCGFEEVDLGIKILPDQASFELQTGASQSILISGGKRPYSATLSGQVPEGTTLTRSGFDQQPVVAVVTAGSEAGEFDLAIQGASSNGGILVHFTIVAPGTNRAPANNRPTNNRLTNNPPANNPPANNPPVSGAGSVQPTTEEDQRNAKQHRVAQYALGLRDGALTGTIDQVTRDKVKAYQEAHGLLTTGTIDDKLYSDLVKAVDSEWSQARPHLTCTPFEDALNVFECTQLTEVQVKALQNKLHVAESGQLDDVTRAAIANDTHQPEDRPTERKALSLGLLLAIVNE